MPHSTRPFPEHLFEEIAFGVRGGAPSEAPHIQAQGAVSLSGQVIGEGDDSLLWPQHLVFAEIILAAVPMVEKHGGRICPRRSSA